MPLQCHSWLSLNSHVECPQDWKMGNTTLTFKNKGLESYRLAKLTSVLGKGDGESLPGNISKHMKDKKLAGTSHNGFIKEQACLTNLIALHNQMTSLVNEGRTAHVVYLSFDKAFGTVSSIIDELTK